MNNIMKENLRELLVAGINTYNPEWIDLCEEANELLDGIIDSISDFSDECLEEDPKEEALEYFSKETRDELKANGFK